MIRRKRSPIKRFLSTMLLRLVKLVVLGVVVIALSFGWLWSGRSSRAIDITRPDPEPPPPSRPTETLRLLTYNIAHGRGPGLNTLNTEGGTPEERLERLEAIGADLRGLGLDIVFLQEVDFDTYWSHGVDQASVIAKAAGFPYIIRQRTIDTGVPGLRRYDFGNALLSRLPIGDTRRIDLEPYSTWEDLIAGNHDALITQVQLGGDTTIRVLGAHLEVRSEEVRVKAAQTLLKVQRESATPFILLGDLNSTPTGLPDSQITAGTAQNTIELLESFGPLQRRPLKGQASHLDFTFPSEAPRRIIDWILPDANWMVLEYRVLRDIQHSDHLPVLATLKRR